MERPEFTVTPFVEGDEFRRRKEDCMGRLAGAEYKGLKLDRALASSIYGWISEDAGGAVRGPRHWFRFIKGLLAQIRSNLLLGDLRKRPIVGISLHRCADASGAPWVAAERSRKTVDFQLTKIIGDCPHASLDIEPPQKFTTFPPLSRIADYVRLYRTCSFRFSAFPFHANHNLAMQAIWQGDIAEQARTLLSKHRPSAILAHREFTGFSNTIIQVARAHDVPTYATQHAIHEEFTGRSDRPSSVWLDYWSSDTYVCWGEFNQRQLASYHLRHAEKRRLLVHCRPTFPSEKQISIDKTSRENIKIDEIIVSLMGTRHERANLDMLDLVFATTQDNPRRIIVRPHPTLSRGKYLRYVDYQKTKYNVEAELTDSRATVQSTYTERSLGVTGLTSTYYENLFFGVPVVFVDAKVELVEPLPRVLPGVTSLEELKEQIRLIESMSWADWYERADPVCSYVYNRECLDFGPRESILDLVRADAESPLSSDPVSIFSEQSSGGLLR